MRPLPLFLLLSALTALPAAAETATNATPADLYGDLFVRVQSEKIFTDGKTFVDARPKNDPAAIMAAYRAQTPKDRTALKAFVERHFDVPSEAPAPEATSERLTLRAHIKTLWPHLTRPAFTPAPGDSALGLPQPYVVPGGRFREIYYWDSYFTLLGLKADGETELAQSMVGDFVSLIERYGHIPNGTRTYYLSRSQPPFFALMVGLLPTDDAAEKTRRLTALRAEHAYWMAGATCVSVTVVACRRVVRLPDGTLLNRYYDDRDTPRDESYAEDVATAALTNRPKAEVYRHLRAGAESGWDYSSRWLADGRSLATIRTTDIVPVDLNALMWTLETQIAQSCLELKDRACATDFRKQADRRAKAVTRYLWVAREKRFADLDFRHNRPTPVLSAATLFPLFTGMATKTQAAGVAETTRAHLLAQGGLRTTQNPTGQQWDSPNGWAPLQWVAVSGLERYGHDALARDIAERWLGTVARTYDETGKMLEKYDVEARRPGGGGEYSLQDGFGWTNGVTRALLERYTPTADHAANHTE